MAGNQRVWDLRRLSKVVIPNGVQRIGDYWFFESSIKEITISKSVKSIGMFAFCRCEQLNCVTFSAESELEEIGEGSF